MLSIPRYFSSQPQTPTYAVTQAGIAYNAATRIDAANSASALVGNPERRTTNFGFSDVLDAAGKYVDIRPSSPVFTRPFCLVICFKSTGTINNGGTILSLAGTSGLNNRVDIYFATSGNLTVDFYSLTGLSTTLNAGAGTFSLNGSYILALANNNGSLQLYVNGVLKSSGSAPLRDGEASLLRFGGSGAGAVPNIDLAGISLSRGVSGFASLINSPWQIFVKQPFKLSNFLSVTYTYSRPSSDITTQWTPSTGTDHYALIDETTADDTDYLLATGPGQTDEVKLASMTPPQVGTNLTINYKVTGVDGGATVTVSLRQGSAGTLIKTDTTRNANGTYALAVAPADWAAVTDWSDLRLRFVSA